MVTSPFMYGEILEHMRILSKAGLIGVGLCTLGVLFLFVGLLANLDNAKTLPYATQPQVASLNEEVDVCGYCHAKEEVVVEVAEQTFVAFDAQHHTRFQNDARYEEAVEIYQTLQFSPSANDVQLAQQLEALVASMDNEVNSGILTTTDTNTFTFVVATLSSVNRSIGDAVESQVFWLPNQTLSLSLQLMLLIVPLCIVYAVHRRGPPEEDGCSVIPSIHFVFTWRLSNFGSLQFFLLGLASAKWSPRADTRKETTI